VRLGAAGLHRKLSPMAREAKRSASDLSYSTAGTHGLTAITPSARSVSVCALCTVETRRQLLKLATVDTALAARQHLRGSLFQPQHLD
jgi:hypothetical protein